MAKSFSREVRTVMDYVQHEIEDNQDLTEDEQKLGRPIMLLMSKVSDMANGALLDDETVQLIEEVFGHDIPVVDESIMRPLEKVCPILELSRQPLPSHAGEGKGWGR